MGDNDGGCCLNCARLEIELAAARREIERLRRQVRRLQQVIQMARAACVKWLAQTRTILSKKSGVPRGMWAFARGAHEVAVRLLGILSQGGG